MALQPSASPRVRATAQSPADAPPLPAQLLLAHNIVLCFLSAAMFGGLASALYDYIVTHGVWHVYCDPEVRLAGSGRAAMEP